MRKERLIIVASVIGLAISAGAQSLNKEIKIDREIVPEYRDADRLPISPIIALPAVSRPNLSYSLLDSPVGVTPSIYQLPVLNPIAQLPEIYPGYASVGFMLPYNLSASVGYSFINTEKTRLGAWLQYNGRMYNPCHGLDNVAYPGAPTPKNTEHAATAGVTLTHRTGESSALKASVDYTYYYYDLYNMTNSRQGVNNINADISWNSVAERGFFYGVGADFSRFAFTHQNACLDNHYVIYLYRAPIRQNVLGANGNVGFGLSKESKVKLGVDFSYLNSPVKTTEGYIGESLNTWLVRFTPGYHYNADRLAVDLGVKVDLTHGAGKSLHIAPDVKVVYRPADFLGIHAEAGGGEVQNTAASIYAVMPYMTQLIPFANSHIPFTLDAGVTVGPFKGGYAELFGGWAKANEWLMPTGPARDGLSPVNVSGWHGGVTIGYRYGKKLDVKASAEAASGSNDITHAYYLWRDRAKYAINAAVTYLPIEKLELNASYTLRGNRVYVDNDLENINSLNFGIKYGITDQVSIFLNAENLLNKAYNYIGNVRSQGFTGLVGVTVKY